MSLVVLQDIYILGGVRILGGIFLGGVLIGRVCPWWCYRIFIFLVVLGLYSWWSYRTSMSLVVLQDIYILGGVRFIFLVLL